MDAAAFTVLLIVAVPATALGLQLFARRVLSVVTRDDSRDTAGDLAGVQSCALHLLMLYTVVSLGALELRVGVSAAEGVFAVFTGAAFAVASFFGLRRFQRLCTRMIGDPIGGSLTPATLRGLEPIAALLAHVVLCPVAQELFFRRLLLSRVGALLPDAGGVYASYAISGVLCFATLALPDGVWCALVVRAPFGVLLSGLHLAGGGFGASFLAHTAHNLAEFALIALGAHLTGKGD